MLAKVCMLLVWVVTVVAACIRPGIAEAPAIDRRERSPSLKERQEGLGSAVSLFRAGKLEAARTRLREELEEPSTLRDYLLFYLARTEQALGEKASSERLYAELADRYPSSVWQPTALLELARRAWEAGDYPRTKRLASRASRSPEADDETQDSARLLLLRLEERSNPRRAYSSYQELRRCGKADLAQAARSRLKALRATHPELFEQLNSAQLLEEGRARLAEGDPEGALDFLKSNDSQFIHHPLRPRQLLTLARALFATKGIGAASVLYEKLLSEHPQSEVAPEAHYELAYGLWNRNRDSEAEAAFAGFLERYPKNRRAARSLYALARIAEEGGRSETAFSRYQELAASVASESLRLEAKWRLGWIHYLAKDFQAASQVFANPPKEAEGRELARFLYWQGRATELAEQKRGLKLPPSSRLTYCKVLNVARESYYAGLAEARLGVLPRELKLPPPSPITPPRILSSTYQFHFERSLKLREARLGGFVSRELAAIDRQAKKRGHHLLLLPYLVVAYSEVGDYWRATRAALKLKQLDNEPLQSDLEAPPLYRYLYPLAFPEPLERAAERSGVNPCMALAVMRQESLFDKRAVSSANALGLMQLLLPTARKAARKAGIGRSQEITRQLLFDPGVNLELGTTYLAELLELTRSRIPRALAAYNAGEEALAKWESRYPQAAEDELVERISYPETRSYVKRVLANSRLYQRLYGNTFCRSKLVWPVIAPHATSALKPAADICK